MGVEVTKGGSEGEEVDWPVGGGDMAGGEAVIVAMLGYVEDTMTEGRSPGAAAIKRV